MPRSEKPVVSAALDDVRVVDPACGSGAYPLGMMRQLIELRCLPDNAHIRAIYESAVERQFSTAAINTIISIANKGKSVGSAETKFVQIQEEFDKATARCGRRRVISKTAARLRAASIDPVKRGDAYVGDKWGGKYLGAPDIYHRILDKYGDRLVWLGDVATMRRGASAGEIELPPIAMNRIIDKRARAFTLQDETRVSNTLYEAHCEPDAVEPPADALNDDFAQIQYNIEGWLQLRRRRVGAYDIRNRKCANA